MGGRASGWVVRDAQGACIFVRECYMLICTYVYGIAIPAPKINLITIMGHYKSSK